MSKRLQVLIPDAECAGIEASARSERLPIEAWVRNALRDAQARRPANDVADKLAAIRHAASYSFPTGDIATINDEIARGYRQPDSLCLAC